jgi:hypothetical protein
VQYRLKGGLFKKFRKLKIKEIYKPQEGRPILVSDAGGFLATISNDLKIRIHQKSVGIPSFQSRDYPGGQPTGLIWDGKSLWSSDGGKHVLYRHGKNLAILDTVKSIIPNIQGLAYDGEAIWVLGANATKVARLTFVNKNPVWEGPFIVRNFLPEGVIPSGFAVGFGRIWAVAGGDPTMISVPIPKDLVGTDLDSRKKKDDNGN